MSRRDATRTHVPTRSFLREHFAGKGEFALETAAHLATVCLPPQLLLARYRATQSKETARWTRIAKARGVVRRSARNRAEPPLEEKKLRAARRLVRDALACMVKTGQARRTATPGAYYEIPAAARRCLANDLLSPEAFRGPAAGSLTGVTAALVYSAIHYRGVAATVPELVADLAACFRDAEVLRIYRGRRTRMSKEGKPVPGEVDRARQFLVYVLAGYLRRRGLVRNEGGRMRVAPKP